jgi:hypothetical protein
MAAFDELQKHYQQRDLTARQWKKIPGFRKKGPGRKTGRS